MHIRTEYKSNITIFSDIKAGDAFEVAGRYYIKTEVAVGYGYNALRVLTGELATFDYATEVKGVKADFVIYENEE